MIVRLKDEFDSRRRTIDARFQFYDSPIKRRRHGRNRVQFYKFQFYDSPIKSGYKTASVAAYPFSFNSMIVRLKVSPGRKI